MGLNQSSYLCIDWVPLYELDSDPNLVKVTGAQGQNWECTAKHISRSRSRIQASSSLDRVHKKIPFAESVARSEGSKHPPFSSLLHQTQQKLAYK